MRVVSIGGGPAGLYAGILMKKAFPELDFELHERSRPDETLDSGVVFADETLGFLEQADPETSREIRAALRSWTDIRTFVRGQWTRSSGHGFSAIAHATLLGILRRRAEELGCRIRHGSEAADVERHLDADLVLGADGASSGVRERFAASFGARVELGSCLSCGLDAVLPLDSLAFAFVETAHGLFQAHVYPCEERRASFVVETDEDAWRAAGLDRADAAGTVATCEHLFADVLEGGHLTADGALWRRHPSVTCASWRHGHVVLLGDAAHATRVALGSDVAAALEDAVALVSALAEHGWQDVPRALGAYESARRPAVARLQRDGRAARRWFESARLRLDQAPVVFTFGLITRSPDVTYDEVRRRDPRLVEALDREFGASHGRPATPGESPVPPAFVPLRVRRVELANRIVVSPMCQYSARAGEVGDWHLAHLGSRALGGAGLVISEMTDVEPAGRITHACAGLWNDEQATAWKRIVEFVHATSGARIGVQLAHAGRKASMRVPWEGGEPLTPAEGAWTAIAPSAVPFRPGWPVPRAMDRVDLERVREAFAAAARRAEQAGFDWIELHCAHGYLLSTFLSPLVNHRTDDYGGALANRMRYPLEVFRTVRAVWPASRPISVRISATDWFEAEGRGTTLEESVAFAHELRDAGCDLVDVSAGGNVPESRPETGPVYQAAFAERIRLEAGVPVMAVGGILDADHANTVLGAGRADLAVIARAHLADPYLTLHAATRYGVDVPWPNQYLRGRPAGPR